MSGLCLVTSRPEPCTGLVAVSVVSRSVEARVRVLVENKPNKKEVRLDDHP